VNRGAQTHLGALLGLLVLLAACAPGQTGQPAATNGEPRREAPKRLVAGIMGDPPTLRNTVHATGGSGSTPGLDTVEDFLNVGLTTLDNRGRLQPRIAEAVPTLENGLWKVAPDGRMETVWKIRPGAAWHDGTPFTAQDLAFTLSVGQDRELALFRDAIYDSIESAEIADAQTFTVRWREPFIDADRLFGTQTPSVPLPRHLLEQPLLEDKASFAQLPYWGPGFVGTGPFKLQEFARGSHLLLSANDRYVLGRPKIDEIEVKFIPDSSTLVANLLAGAVELSLGRNLSLDQALQIRDDWKDGRVEAGATNWIAIYPQHLNPNPAALGDVRFRRALLHAVDRQTLGESLQGGVGTVAQSIQLPDAPEYQVVQQRIVRYEYDPTRAVRLLEELGYTRGPDGVERDGSGQRLGIELRNTGLDIEIKSTLAVADYWQRAGIPTEPAPVPPQRARDREYRANYPALELVGNPNNLGSLVRLRSSQVPLPDNNYTGLNRARYASPELDALLDRYFTTIPMGDRMEALGRIVQHLSDQVVWMGLFDRLDPAMIGNRVQGVTPRTQDATQGWNVHEWQVQ
jgi:peptide/nickel transport system substrate-binding protein